MAKPRVESVFTIYYGLGIRISAEWDHQMTHGEQLNEAIRSVATSIPGFEQLAVKVQQRLIELGEEYFREEYVPRLVAVINVPRYEESLEERTEVHREFIEDHREFLDISVMKAQRAAQEQLRETYDAMMKRARP
jgi:hypothetical protein